MIIGPERRRRLIRRGVPLLLVVGRYVAWALFAGTAVFGMIFMSPRLLVLGTTSMALLGAVAAAAVSLLRGSARLPRPARRPSPADVTAGAVIGGGAIPFGLGLFAMPPQVSAPVVGSLAANAVLRILARRPDRSDADEPGEAVELWDEEHEALLRSTLRVVSLSVLLDQWRTTGRDLHRPGPSCGTSAQLRRLLLEELERRDPDGVDRWLRSGRTDPEPFLARGRDVDR